MKNDIKHFSKIFIINLFEDNLKIVAEVVGKNELLLKCSPPYLIMHKITYRHVKKKIDVLLQYY